MNERTYSETDLRVALHEYAEAYQPSGRPALEPHDTARPRRRRAWSATALVAAATAAVVIGTQAGNGVPGGGSSAVDGSGHTVTIELAGYAAPKGGEPPAPLRKHLACMRARGYQLPDPTWTGHGWLLTVRDADSAGIGTRRWKRTAFVTCALTRSGGGLPRGLRHVLMHPRPRGAAAG
jgi:hypothetical protein